MATAVVVGVGAVAAAILGRSIIKRGLFVGKGAAEFAKGGFRAKMDRKEAIQILGLTCALCSTFRHDADPFNKQRWSQASYQLERCSQTDHACQPS